MNSEAIPSWLTAPVASLVGPLVRLEVLESREDVHHHFARHIVSRLRAMNRAHGRALLILPVGPTAHYPECARLINEEGVSLSGITIIHMDEYVDADEQWISDAHPLSFRGVMTRLFYNLLNPRLGSPRVIFPNPGHLSVISQTIREMGGVDVAYGGIGIHGHVAFNEPLIGDGADELMNLPARVVTLNPETVVMNASRSLGGWLDGFPRRAVTIGIPELLAAREVVLYADGGTWQRTTLRKAVRGEADPAFPVTFLTSRRPCHVVTDAVTAGGILD